MGYQFRLEALKRFRHFQEETSQKEFSDAKRLYEREVKTLTDMVALRKKTEGDMERENHKATTSPQIAIYAKYLERLDRQITAQQVVTTQAHQKCEMKRQELMIAMQKRKTLDKLKEHGLNAYLQNLNHEEEKFINEMAINRHILNAK